MIYRILLSLFISLLCLFVSVTEVRAEDSKFKIGMILPLSGPAADYGQSIENCVSLARADQPELFSNIQFIYEDAFHDPTKAVSALRKLMSIDKVDLVYTWGVPFCKALAPIAESRKIPFVGQCIDQISSAGRKYVVRFMNYTDEYLQVQTLELKKRGLNRIGVLLGAHPYLGEMYAALKRSLREGQSVKLIDSYQIHNTDLKSSISKIRRSDFDVIGVFLYPGQVAQFYRQAREQKMELPTFGTNLFESVSELKLAGGAMDGSIFTTNTVHTDFIRRYVEKYKNVSQLGFGALAYEFSLLAGKLYNERGSQLSAEEIINRLTSLPPPGRYRSRSIRIQRLKNCRPILLLPHCR